MVTGLHPELTKPESSHCFYCLLRGLHVLHALGRPAPGACRNLRPKLQLPHGLLGVHPIAGLSGCDKRGADGTCLSLGLLPGGVKAAMCE